MTHDLLADERQRKMGDVNVPMPLNYRYMAVAIDKLLLRLTIEENTHITEQTIYADGFADAGLCGENIWGN